ncbi:MAG: methylated-DNA--[protein]-cysteine S-methyltransferase [Planctomycetota bacterium]|jgi:AraC family transcriptional regulator of adaptative response/methylated-DNA-[protein]-cysteine methyltransferase
MSESRDYRRVERAIRFLEANARRRPSLDATAAHVGLSPYHFQRLFRRWAGTSPKRFLSYLTAEHAKECLRDARTVLETTLDAGLSSTGRLHDLLVSVDAVTPGDVRRLGAGLRIRYGVHETPFGRARVAVTARGINNLAFVDHAPPPDLKEEWPRAELVHDRKATAGWVDRIFGGGTAEPLPVLLRGTNLQLRVWEALLRIPEGSVVSYGSLAAALGKPTAARAVAGAVAANPIAYLIPCHRVLRATGAIGGYRWGTARKRAMLGRELAVERVP